jgi:NAD-dependent protein deacetylase/lipoamidase
MSTRRLGIVAKKLIEGKDSIAFTGAGISVESGIPDFRSRGGLWEKFDPMEYATIDAFKRNPEKVWEMLREMDKVLEAADPNPAHSGLARLEELNLINGVVTQNIDNLHQEGGSKQVVEFHGNGRRLICIKCGEAVAAADARARWQEEFPPRCPKCGQIMKPDVVLFGEPIPAGASNQAMRMAQTASVVLVIGTSAMVAPASYIPVVAKKSGAFIVEINREDTILSQEIADLTIRGRAGEIVPALVEQIDMLLAQ